MILGVPNKTQNIFHFFHSETNESRDEKKSIRNIKKKM